MFYLLKPENLSLSIHHMTEDKVSDLNAKLKMLKQDMFYLASADAVEIPIGSKVQITYADGSTGEGRVIGKKGSLEYEVNRDGYKNYMNMDRGMLKNLSLGISGNLEREIWLAERLIDEYSLMMENSEVPSILFDREQNIVEVVKLNNFYPCEIIEFVIGHSLASGRLKIPSGVVDTLGYYEITVVDEKVIRIIRSSKVAIDLQSKVS